MIFVMMAEGFPVEYVDCENEDIARRFLSTKWYGKITDFNIRPIRATGVTETDIAELAKLNLEEQRLREKLVDIERRKKAILGN